MRVALLSCNAQTANAIGKQVREKVLFFVERGADVRLFVESAHRLDAELTPYCEVVARAEAAGPAWDFLRGADLVIAEYPHWYDLLHFLPLLAGGKPRIVVEYHGVTPPALWHGPHRDLLQHSSAQRGIVWCADAVIAHSKFTRDELHEATGYPLERITTMPCVVTNHVPPGDDSRCDSAALLFVGRLAANKRVPVLIEALGRLRDERPEVHAFLAGDTSDVYADEARRCEHLATRLGVQDRLHWLGQPSDGELQRRYRDADALVMPSVHEGFCLPVAEAMAAGLPVIAARAAALPETVGDAGLTFRPDDPDDLARQVRRVLADRRSEPASKTNLRIAIVAFRLGSDIVGGAERSLRTIATTLKQGGHHVEVFSTCTRSESIWRNELAAGTSDDSGIVLHRFPIDAHDREQHLHSVRVILEAHGKVCANIEDDYLRHSIHSSALVKALGDAMPTLDAVLVGPYLFGLTHDVATAFAGKTLLLPCFHDEPLARLAAWARAYTQVGGILYHSPEEQDFAQTTLGLNHPRAALIGTLLDRTPAFETKKDGPRTLVYCGRYSAQKNVPLLLDFIARYRGERPHRFRWIFMGQGEVPIPREIADLGRVSEERKTEVLASADAIVQLSVNESLSLVALEAWAQGTPVIVHADCAVLAGHLSRVAAGRTVANYDDFARTLDDLWDHPADWRARGLLGRDHVRRSYGGRDVFLSRLVGAIHGLTRPLGTHMRERGLERAKLWTRDAWRDQFGALVENVLDTGRVPLDERIEIALHRDRQSLSAGTRRALIPVRLRNVGNQVFLADGPARIVLCGEVIAHDDGQLAIPRFDTEIPGILAPDATLPAAISFDLPGSPGAYQVRLWARHVGQASQPDRTAADSMIPGSEATLELMIDPSHAGTACTPLLEDAMKSLAEAHRCQQLPDDYVDVTEGLFARWKRWIKRKLLGNFKHAYVDVLSRQQTQVNQHLVACIQNLAECCATLEHALREQQERSAWPKPSSDAPMRRDETPVERTT